MNYRALDKGPRNLWPGLDTANVKASRDARRCGRKKDAMGMKLMKNEGLQTPSWRVSTSAGEQVSHVPTLFAKSARRMGHRPLVWMGRLLLVIWLAAMAWSQGVSTTTVQGTVYLANGQPGAGTLVISWPGFTTAAGQAVAADSTDGDDCAGWICEREPRAEPGRDARGRVLHGRVLHERWDGEHAVLGDAGSGTGDAGAGAGADDAGGAGGAGGEQGVRGRGDHGVEREPADGVGRNAERAAVFERGSDAADAGGDQALRGYAGGDGGSAGGRQHDGRADDAGGERRGSAHGSERTDDAAGGDERGGNEWGDGDSAELCGDGHGLRMRTA